MYNRDYKNICKERYDIAKSMVEHYIKDRNLTGWKLEGRIHDRI